jgi:hypothetical protein
MVSAIFPKFEDGFLWDDEVAEEAVRHNAPVPTGACKGRLLAIYMLIDLPCLVGGRSTDAASQQGRERWVVRHLSIANWTSGAHGVVGAAPAVS